MFATGGSGGGRTAAGSAGAQASASGGHAEAGRSQVAGAAAKAGGEAGVLGTTGGGSGPETTGAVGGSSSGGRSDGVAGADATAGMPQSRGGSSGASGVGVGGSANAGALGTSGAGAGGSDAGEEVCNALDDDGNGIVDDVDAGGDGVCDCLRIATLGNVGHFGSGNFVTDWLEPRAPRASIDALQDQVLTPEVLSRYDLVLAFNVSRKQLDRDYTDEEAQALASWVKDGGGLMTLSGYADAAEVTNANRLLAAFDLRYEGAGIFVKPGTQSVAISEFSTHPIAMGVAAVGMDNGHEPRGTGTVYAKKGQVNIGIAQEVGKGHLDVWADEWITYSGEWRDRAEYNVPRFWLNTLQWLTRSRFCQVPLP